MELKDEIFEEYSNVIEVKLPAMRVVHYNIISESPEELALATIGSWAKRKGLWDMSSTRIFGYNWPDPKEGEKLYGYEFCITIPDDWTEDDCFPFPVKTLPAGKFGSYRFKFKDMKKAWSMMIGWMGRMRGYDFSSRELGLHWMEETFCHKKVFDDPGDTDMILYIPIIPVVK